MADPHFDFPQFYTKLAGHGLVIYPGKLTEADCFRIGSIGRLFEADVKHC
jgi:2-aminoethylphosphonate-pyruvate transaminase